MNPYKLDHTTSLYIKKELEKIQSIVAPFIKKSTIYILISIPLISFSLINLYVLLFNVGVSRDVAFIVGGFSLLGAFGIALYKESMHQNKKIHKTSVAYITERIAANETVPDYAKKTYLERLHSEPINALTIFYEFLQHEERIKKIEGGL